MFDARKPRQCSSDVCLLMWSAALFRRFGSCVLSSRAIFSSQKQKRRKSAALHMRYLSCSHLWNPICG
jgi:hypothetical protein